jgi:AcrR family transcriptional regulator
MLRFVPGLPPSLTDSSLEDRRLSRATQVAERREQALARMTEVFAKRGYQAATVPNLIAGAKISMGNFYKEFEGKEDCFVEAYDRVITHAQGRLAAEVTSDQSWEEQAIGGAGALLDLVAEEPMGARLVLVEAQTSGPVALRHHAETLAALADFLRLGRKFGCAAAKLPPTAEEAAVSGLVWLLQSRLTRDGLEDIGGLKRHVARMVLEPYVGRDQALRATRSD